MLSQKIERLNKVLFHINKELKKLLKVARAFEVKKQAKKDEKSSLVEPLKKLSLDQVSFWIISEKMLSCGLWEKIPMQLDNINQITLSKYISEHLKPSLKLSGCLEDESTAAILFKKNVIQNFVKAKMELSMDYWTDRVNLEKSARLVKKRKLEKIQSEKAEGLSLKIAAKNRRQQEEGEESDVPMEDSFLKKNNRMGQRARRKMWEEKFGNEAKHLKVTVKPQITEKAKNQPDLKDLHPSWQSKKLQKQSIQPFSGTKIVFD